MSGCDRRTYTFIDRNKIDTMLKELESNGAAIKDCNPWYVETHQHGIKLMAEWNEALLSLTVSVTHRNWYVSYKAIWNTIDSLIGQISETKIV